MNKKQIIRIHSKLLTNHITERYNTFSCCHRQTKTSFYSKDVIFLITILCWKTSNLTFEMTLACSGNKYCKLNLETDINLQTVQNT